MVYHRKQPVPRGHLRSVTNLFLRTNTAIPKKHHHQYDEKKVWGDALYSRALFSPCWGKGEDFGQKRKAWCCSLLWANPYMKGSYIDCVTNTAT